MAAPREAPLKRVMEVSWWRTGKPLSMIRTELIRRETRAAAEAKKNGDPPPPSVFGTEELAAPMPGATTSATPCAWT